MKLHRPIAWLVPAVLGTMLANWALLLALELLLDEHGGRGAHGLWFPGMMTVLFGTPVGIGLTLISLLADLLLHKRALRTLPTGLRGWLLSLLTVCLFTLSAWGSLKLLMRLQSLTSTHLMIGLVLVMIACVTGVRLALGNRSPPSR